MIKNAFISLWRLLAKYHLKRTHVFIGKNVRFNKKTNFEGYNAIYDNADISSSGIGRGTYVSRDCILKSSKIGRFCSIAPEVRIMIGNHPVGKNISTHPSFFSTRKQAGFTFTDRDTFNEIEYAEEGYIISIGNDVWIGQGVLIKQGVSIGNGAVIGAGSLILTDVEPYAVYAGLPAKRIRMRMDKDDVDYILKHPWWEMDMNDISTIQKHMIDMKSYREIFKEQ